MTDLSTEYRLKRLEDHLKLKPINLKKAKLKALEPEKKKAVAPPKSNGDKPKTPAK